MGFNRSRDDRVTSLNENQIIEIYSQYYDTRFDYNDRFNMRILKNTKEKYWKRKEILVDTKEHRYLVVQSR